MNQDNLCPNCGTPVYRPIEDELQKRIAELEGQINGWSGKNMNEMQVRIAELEAILQAVAPDLIQWEAASEEDAREWEDNQNHTASGEKP